MLSPACLAATRIAEAYGYRADDPAVVQETNNTVVWLRPHALIAKVGKWAQSEEALLREHAIAAALAAEGAPVAPPLETPLRDPQTGFLVTLWRWLDHDAEREIAPAELAASLRHLHEGLARYRGDLPDFRVGLALARAALADDDAMRALARHDRAFLRAAFDRLLSELEARVFVVQPLHGEPHDGNLLATPSGPRWIDLEAACVGPLEWDLAFLPD